MNFKQHLEALIFCAETPLSLEDLQRCLSEVFAQELKMEWIRAEIEALVKEYQEKDTALQIVFSGGGYQFLTKAAYEASVTVLLKQHSKKRLSTAAMETLAIIAYKQPISKGEIEKIRGVSSDYAVQKLLEKELIEIRGKAETIGKPLLYGTTQKFMDYFGINQIQDLPQIKDFSTIENSIGTEN